jgi:hypothetical protein
MANGYVRLTMKSGNKKTGPIPVSTTADTSCPDSCPLKRDPNDPSKSGGCYAKGGPLLLVWRGVAEKGISWAEFCEQIDSLPEGQLWRHNQAGDLPGDNEDIDIERMTALVLANAGKRGFTYTHKPLAHGDNEQAIRYSNENGFTVNISCNSIEHLDEVAENYPGLPLTTILPIDGPKTQVTPGGTKIVTCPATYRDEVSCATCKLCQVRDRGVAVGFPVHGFQKKKAGVIAENSH